MEPFVPPSQRGATRISERVVAKLAAQAAREALSAAAPAPLRPPSPPPPPVRVMPHATAAVRRPPAADGTGGVAAIRVAVELGYPSDIAAQCRRVRRHVARTVSELAGMDTAEVAVDVERLHSVHSGGRTRSRVR
ncbi:hypothetical protein [Streptomyces sp. 7-21]|uniref:hypothetical protein n=1 Tax=Streptomyces sp. 7-21 TaxID=2802283 RepID=UPI00191FDBE5|nr:hypothetical protein [Streptomyces sp. 7-21]MBL1069150.1 hypothetical protein [Streptomyces sp. 7-21]